MMRAPRPSPHVCQMRPTFKLRRIEATLGVQGREPARRLWRRWCPTTSGGVHCDRYRPGRLWTPGRQGHQILLTGRLTRNFGGMEVSDAKRLKQLEDENRRLKKLVADLTLDKEALKDVLGRKW